VVASPDYLFQGDADFETAYRREVAKCGPLQEMLVSATPEDRIRGIRRLAYRNRQIAGPGWVMIGDAAAFLDPIYSSGLFLALASAELAANCIHKGLASNDVSAETLSAFAAPLWGGIEVIRRLIYAFYDPNFSFHDFVERFPELRAPLISCLVGDVVGHDMSEFLGALAQMTPAPAPL
jgi:flavin-dependent dehydrogenase